MICCLFISFNLRFLFSNNLQDLQGESGSSKEEENGVGGELPGQPKAEIFLRLRTKEQLSRDDDSEAIFAVDWQVMSSPKVSGTTILVLHLIVVAFHKRVELV